MLVWIRNTIELIDALQKEGKFKLRMYAMVSNSSRKSWIIILKMESIKQID